jgi:hypothetical protein
MAGISVDSRFPISSVAGFNLGIETGQLMVAAGLGGLSWTLAIIGVKKLFLSRVASAAGLLAGLYWLSERL